MFFCFFLEPEPIQSITVENHNSTAVEVTWVKPAEEPGPVTYVVTYDDMIESGTHPGCTVEGTYFSCFQVVDFV